MTEWGNRNECLDEQESVKQTLQSVHKGMESRCVETIVWCLEECESVNSMEEWNLDVWEPLYGGTGMGVWSMGYLVWTEVIGSELSVHSRCGRGSTGPVWLSREN